MTVLLAASNAALHVTIAAIMFSGDLRISSTSFGVETRHRLAETTVKATVVAMAIIWILALIRVLIA